ncbi:hypothetical protein PhCBS80983_g01266 [Powellomyces hirtus]|uniref:Protein kinase domain-containing protein n=1 Tax=Powellomyces hirtus TaxID=109895 RepID=A0A507EAP8_9FUNG|nr:hypothetical protein PhCBS80983_g01266 [Powellomyces hirtus]
MDPITTAYNTVVAIRSVVVAIKLKETQCRTLCERAERAVTSLQHLAARTAGGKLEPGAHQQALVFAALLDKILHFMQRLNAKSFLHRFVTLHVLDAELDDLRAQLDYLVADLQLAIGMDARGLREQDARDRGMDKKALEDQLLALAADQQRILVALGVRPSEYTEAMEAVKKTMLSPPPSSSTSDSEQKFAKAAYTALVRASGSETPTITVKEWTITSYEVEIGDVFARGGFGEVCMGTWRGLTTVAVKRLPGGLESKRKKKLFVKEVEVWFRLRHPNVMLLLGACWSAVQMENGTLLSYAEKYPDQTLKLLHESAQGLHYLHTSNVVHGDLKAVNILVDGAGTPKLADFGFSTLKSSSLSTNTTSTIRTLSGHTLPGGTIRWCAPELLSGASSTFGSDIYAFGMVMYEVLSGGDLPFSTITSELVVMKQALSGARPERPPGVADAVWEVVGWCWRQDTGERVSMHVVAGGLGRVMGRGVGSRPVSVVGGPVKGGGVQTMTPVEEGNSGGTGPLSLPPPYAEQTKRQQQQQPSPPAPPVVKFDSSPKKPSPKPPHHRHHHIPHSASFNNTPPSLVHTTGKQQQSASFDHLPMHTTPEPAHPNSNSNSNHNPHGASLINIPPSQPLPPHLSTTKQNLTPPNSAPAFISKPMIEMPTPTPSAPKPPHLPPSTSLNNMPPKLTFNTNPTDTKPPPAPPIPLGIAFPRSPTNGSGTTSWSLSPTAVTAPASNTRRASVGTTQLQPPIAPLGSVGNITPNNSNSTPQASVAHTNTSNANTNSISSNNANNSSKKKLPMVAAVPAIIESAHLEECEEGAHGADTPDHPTDASTNSTNAKKPKQVGFTPDPSTPISRRQKRKKCCLCILLPLLILIAIVVIIGLVGITQNKGFLFLGAGNSTVKKTNSNTTTTTGGSSGDTTAFDYTTSSQCAGMVSESVWGGTNLQSFPLLVPTPPSRVASRLLWGVASSCTHLISAFTNSSSNSVGVSVYEFPPTATDLVSPQAERVVQLIGSRVIAGTSSSGDQMVWSDDTVVHVTSTTSGTDTARFPLNKHIVKLALPSNGKMERVFAHSDDGTITEWSLTTKMQTRQYGPSNTRRADGVSPLASVITVDGGILAFAPDNTTIQWWSTGPGNGVLLKSISVPTGTAAPLPLTFSPAGSTLFFLLGSTQFQRVDIGSGTFGKTYSGDWVQFGSTLAVTSDAQYGFGVGVYGSGGSGFTSFVVQIRLDTGAVQKLQLTRWATTTLPSPDAARVALTSDDKYVVFSLGANSGAVKMVTYDNTW